MVSEQRGLSEDATLKTKYKTIAFSSVSVNRLNLYYLDIHKHNIISRGIQNVGSTSVKKNNSNLS